MGTSSIVLILSLVFISLLVACTILLVVFWIKKRKNNNNTKAHSSLKHKHQISNMFANSKYLGETNNEDLKKIYQLIDNHQNILIVGTNIETITLKLQNIIYQYKKFYKKRIVILSATKTSITNLDSVSIDKFIGINENNIKYQTIIKSKTWNDIANHLKNIDILIINDVSTINPQVFDLLNKLMQVACNNKKQFGDKIIICSAYLFSKKVNKSHDFQIFHTNTWIKSNFSHIQLTNKAN